ncbi:hypothetical protein CMV_010894 [Castanea mollissima]|uniref:Uncharacterized protein n=1 Tax=Castanea mollissima TaxID=60419 RepID=A0A8J4RM97_9ROSI|nr:hypothetical protein CMV_010894 [Castanea mollissima]
MVSDKIRSIILWPRKSEPVEEPVVKQSLEYVTHVDFSWLPHSIRRVEVRDCNSLDLQSFIQLLPEIIGLPLNLPPCVISDMLMFPHSSTMLPIGSTIKRTEYGPCEYSFEELFRDLQLTDRNHVQILCKTFDLYGDPGPIVKKIGVHVECSCLSLQSGLGLPMYTENESDLGLAIDSSNVDGFDLGSSSVAQLVTPQIRSNPNPMAITFSDLHTESVPKSVDEFLSGKSNVCKWQNCQTLDIEDYELGLSLSLNTTYRLRTWYKFF